MYKRQVLGFDPAFRTGCKLAFLNENGDVLEIGVIYPHEPKKEVDMAEKIILALIQKHNIKIIAIVNFGNRSDEDLTSQLLRETKCKESTNSARKERMKVKKFLRPLYSLSQIHEITDLENVYLIILHINDLKNELERIRCEYSLSLK